MNPKISVLLPVYNGAATILKAIDSILNQTFTDFELLVIDDGSTDNTTKLLSQITDTRLAIYTFNKNVGIAKALNYGLKIAKAPFIARMDADDISLPERLEKQFNYLQKNLECGLVSCLVKHGGDPKTQKGYAHYVRQVNQIIEPDDLKNKCFQESPFAHPSVMFRKELVEKYGGYNEMGVPEDYELWLRWMHHGVRLEKLNEQLLIWNDPPNRLSRNHPAYSDDNFFHIKAKYLALHFRKTKKELPVLWVWGTGKTVNKHSNHLLIEGFKIEKYIDIKPTATERRIHYSNIPAPSSFIIVSYVRDRKGKKEIESFLNIKGYQEGKNYFLMS